MAASAGGVGANWCTYATWASRQAGSTIRGEDLGDDLQRRVHDGGRVLPPTDTLWRRPPPRGPFHPPTPVGGPGAGGPTPLAAVGLAGDAVAPGGPKGF